MPTFAVALALTTAFAGASAPARDGALITRVQTTQAPAAAPVAASPQAAMPFTQAPLPGQAAAPPAVVYQGPPGQALSDPAIEARINAQIEALLVPPNGGFTVQRYARPDTGNSGSNGGAPSLVNRNGGGTGSSGQGGGGAGGASPLQQAGYPNGGSGGGFAGGQGGGGQSGFGAQSGGGPFGGGQGGGQGGGRFGGGGGQGGYPAQANFQGQQNGYGGGQAGGFNGQGGSGGGFNGQGGSGGGQGGGFPGQGGYGGGQAGGFNGYGQGGGYGPPPVKRYAVARAGDTVFATLDQGYNSDDPQAPIFATIYDVDSAQRPGPLNGVRLIGQIVYSTNQAAIQFTQMVLLDGRQFPLKAYAISARDARTGVSDDVDEHTFERYAGLFAATLIQGAGQAGQLLLQTNRNVVIDPATGLALSSPGSGVRTQAALAALLPLGQAATAIGAQNFNKPATIAGAPGFGLGVVFLEPPALPRDAIYLGAGGAVYRGGNLISRLN